MIGQLNETRQPMIASMTAYARTNQEGSWGSLTWELRSVNHRYLDITLKLPENARSSEAKIRAAIQTKCQRGKIEATLKYTPGLTAPVSLKLNETMLTQIADAYKTVHAKMLNVSIEASRLMSWPGLMETDFSDNDTLNLAIIHSLNEALDNFIATRQREGQGLVKFLLDHCENLRKQVVFIESHLPTLNAMQKDKFLARAKELQITLDKDRLEQEILIWAQRADVSEEIQRLHAHLHEVERVIQTGDVVGRRLDFLMQELNREANTLSSKSTHIDSTQAVIEIKVLIEQMREQVQNIE